MIYEADNEEQLKLCHSIRTEVFVEEQCVDPSIEYDQFENSSVHFVSMIENEAVGTVRYRPIDEHTAKIERMAIRRPFRGSGYGKLLLQAAENHAKENGYIKVVLNAQTQALPFYEKMGYQQDGNEFNEAGINHIKALKNLL